MKKSEMIDTAKAIANSVRNGKSVSEVRTFFIECGYDPQQVDLLMELSKAYLEDDGNSFGERLKKARAEVKLTQQGMADKMLIPKRTIEKWESDTRTPPDYVQRFVINELEQMKKEG